MLKYICRYKNISNSLPFSSTGNKFSFNKINLAQFCKEKKAETRSNNSNQNSLEQERESWSQFLDFILKREVYTWEDYLQQIIYSNEKEKGIWRRLKSRNEDEKEEVLITKKFVACLFPDEISKENFELKELKDIIQLTELSKEIITPMIFNFRYYKGVHGHLMNKKRNNLEMPRTQGEMQEEFIKDTPEFMEEIQKTMYNDIKKKLNYSDEYLQKMERNKQDYRFKKYKRTNTY